MLAFAFTAALVFAWGLLGYPIVVALAGRRNLLQSALIAPTIGMSVTLIATFELSNLGMPVARFGPALSIVLVVAMAVLWWRIRPIVPIRRYLPFAGILLLALLATGRPFFRFGFEWSSYGNEDMADYALMALRYFYHGFLAAPDADAIERGTDYSLLYWFLTGPGMWRSGADLTIAWVMSITGLTAHQVYMPVILGFHLCAIGSSGALVLQSRVYRLAALLTCGMLSLSALASLGVLYQLAPQTAGIALLATCATLLLRPLRTIRPWSSVRLGALLTLSASAMLIMYPEVTPFLGLGFLIYNGVGFTRRQLAWRSLVTVGASTGGGVLLLLTTRAWYAINFLRAQAGAGLREVDVSNSIFPYYLMPLGLANVWGFQSLIASTEPWLSISIAIGGALLLLAAIAALWIAWRRMPVASLAVVMLTFGFYLFQLRSDFGLFKLAMYGQPFLLGTVVVAWLTLTARRSILVRVMPLVVLGASSLYAQTFYVGQSGDNPVGAFVEIPYASQNRINQELGRLLTEHREEPVIFDTTNTSLAKFEAYQTLGRAVTFPSRFFFSNISGMFGRSKGQFLDFSIFTTGEALNTMLDRRLQEASYPLYGVDDGKSDDSFIINSLGQPTTNTFRCGLLVASSGFQTIVNRRTSTSSEEQSFIVRPCSQVHDHLMMIHSDLGRHYTTGDPRRTALFQLEPDLLFRGRTMAGMGRHLLFEVVNPTPDAHLLLDMTSTLSPDGEKQLPPAQVISEGGRTPISLVGRGGARVVSPPVTPLSIDGHSYLAIDMGADLKYFPTVRVGLMSLYGTDVDADRRGLIGFGRDISLVAANEYARFAPPSFIHTFPDDLGDRDLEYSGIYEDGWISEASFFGLAAPAERSDVVVKGVVPAIDDQQFQTELRILVDGQEVTRQTLAVGTFEIRAPAPLGNGRRRVELRFSAFQRLPGADRRPAAARMESIGLVPSPATQTAPPVQSQPAIQSANQVGAPSRVRIPDELGKPELRTTGIAADGWAEASSSFDLTQTSVPSQLVLSGVVPNVHDSAFATTLTVLVDGQRVHEQRLGMGDFDLHAPVSAAAGQRHVELRFSATQQLPAPDGRPVGARLARIGFEPVTPAAAAPSSASAPSAPPAVAVAATPSAAAAPAPPQSIANLPADLSKPAVRASGLDTDGWAASAVSLDLSAPDRPSSLVVRGMVPSIGDPGFATVARVLVDGREVASPTLSLGDFELRADAPPGAGKHTVEIRFSAVQQLPAPDGRRVGARLQSIGFESSTVAAQPSAVPPPAPSPEALPADLANPALNVTGLDTDGWLAGTASFDLASPASAASLVLRGVVPMVDDPSFSSELRVLVDGREVFNTTLGLGDFDLHVPLPSASGRRHVELQFSRTQQLPAPDTRRVGARIERAALE